MTEFNYRYFKIDFRSDSFLRVVRVNSSELKNFYNFFSSFRVLFTTTANGGSRTGGKCFTSTRKRKKKSLQKLSKHSKKWIESELSKHSKKWIESELEFSIFLFLLITRLFFLEKKLKLNWRFFSSDRDPGRKTW